MPNQKNNWENDWPGLGFSFHYSFVDRKWSSAKTLGYLYLSYYIWVIIIKLTCKRPSNVRWIVTHLLGCAPFVVIAVIKESSSSRFSFNFLTSDSMALLEKPSLSPPCLWHISEWTILRQASAEVGAVVFMTKRKMFDKKVI